MEGCRPQAAGWFPGAVRRPPSYVPAPCAVFASAAALAIRSTFRREAIQCRSPQIRMLSSRHWIASHL
ncbi:MAG: hypothetical protein LBM98_10990 [Oscillospiraceae bacterium]|nr:hypothetical protein [Oscillospiraceae bacterium]